MRICRQFPITVLTCLLGAAAGFGQTTNQEPLPDDPDQLVQLLGDGDLQRTFMSHKVPNSIAVRAVSALVKMTDDPVPALERALSSSNERLRFNVVYVLARIASMPTLPGYGGSSPKYAGQMSGRGASMPTSDGYGGIKATRNPDAIVRVLIRAASDPHTPVRALAVGSLPAYTSEEARRTLLAALKDGDPQVRNAAIMAFAPGDEKGLDNDVRLATARAIIPLLDNSATQYAAARALGNLRSNAAAIPLLKLLRADDKHVRSQAVQALGLIKDNQVVVELCDCLNDADQLMRVHACNSLGQIGDMRATRALLEALKDKTGDVRLAASQALGKIADVRASDKLIPLLEDSDKHVRSAAAEALGLIGDKGAIDALGKLLLRNNRPSSIAAARALGRFRDPQAVEPLKQFLLLPGIEYADAAAAAESLGQIRHPDAIAALVKASELTGSNGVNARIVLSKITGNSYFENSPELIDAWWQSNREHYYRGD